MRKVEKQCPVVATSGEQSDAAGQTGTVSFLRSRSSLVCNFLTMDSDGEFHSAPSSPAAAKVHEEQQDASVGFSGDEDESEDMSVFQNMVEELITDLSSQEKENQPQSPPQSSQHSLLSSPDFLPAASQRILSASVAGRACRLFVPCLPAADEDSHEADDGTTTAGPALADEPENPIDQLYLDQCCEWFKRETRSTPGTDKNLYAGVGSEVRNKKRKLSDKQ